MGGNTHAHTTSGLAWLGGEREREREPVREQNGWRRMAERRDLHTASIGEQPLTELRASHGGFSGPACSVFFSVVAERERERPAKGLCRERERERERERAAKGLWVERERERGREREREIYLKTSSTEWRVFFCILLCKITSL